jgi:hypothetical protein
MTEQLAVQHCACGSSCACNAGTCACGAAESSAKVETCANASCKCAGSRECTPAATCAAV